MTVSVTQSRVALRGIVIGARVDGITTLVGAVGRSFDSPPTIIAAAATVRQNAERGGVGSSSSGGGGGRQGGITSTALPHAALNAGYCCIWHRQQQPSLTSVALATLAAALQHTDDPI